MKDISTTRSDAEVGKSLAGRDAPYRYGRPQYVTGYNDCESPCRDVFLSSTPSEVIDQAAIQWRDHGARYIVVADVGPFQRSPKTAGRDGALRQNSPRAQRL